MAQHDYDIANASGAVVRADLNSVLEAIATQNAGSLAPATTFAHQWWFDEANNLLKQRNAANTLWVTVALKDSNGWTPYYRGQALGTPFDVSNTDLNDLDETKMWSGNNLTNAPFSGGGAFSGVNFKFSPTSRMQIAMSDGSPGTPRFRKQVDAVTWDGWQIMGAVQPSVADLIEGLAEVNVRMFSPADIVTMIHLHAAIVQRTYDENTSTVALTDTIPEDDTTPVKASEGTEILSATITPLAATNRIRVSVSASGGVSTTGQRGIITIFNGSTCIGVFASPTAATNAHVTVSGTVEFVAGGTSELTISVNAGPSAGASTWQLNGNPSTGRIYGGAQRATLVIDEIAA